MTASTTNLVRFFARFFAMSLCAGALACAGSATAQRAAEPADPPGDTEAIYECDRGAIVMVEGQDGRWLMVGDSRRPIVNQWRSTAGDHFLTFERIGPDRIPVATEYIVPTDRTQQATMRTYDKNSGASFVLKVEGPVWRISGEPSDARSCSVVPRPVGETASQSRPT